MIPTSTEIIKSLLTLLSETASDEIGTPNEYFGWRVPIEITLSALLVLVITANIFVVLKCKVYKNYNSLTIMFCLTIMHFIRLSTFLKRIVGDKYSKDQWVWYRITSDLANYLLQIISLVLLI